MIIYTEQQIRDMVDEQINQSQKNAQYSISKIPYHIHNGVDSPKISSNNIPEPANGTGIICGQTDYNTGVGYWFGDKSSYDWTESRPKGDFDGNWQSIASDSSGKKLIAAEIGKRLYVSSDGGISWSETRPAGNTDKNWQAVASSSNGKILYAIVIGGRVYKSIDSGTSWSEIRPAGNNDEDWQDIRCSIDGSILIICRTNAGGLAYLSINAGTTWTTINGAVTNYQGCAINSSGTFQLLHTGHNIYVSTNKGTTFTDVTPVISTSFDAKSANCDATGKNTIIANAGDNKIYKSSDFGTTWTALQPFNGSNEDLSGSSYINKNGNIIAFGTTGHANNVGIIWYTDTSNSGWLTMQPDGDSVVFYSTIAGNYVGSILLVGETPAFASRARIFIGDISEICVSSIGDSSNEYLTWNNTTLLLKGAVIPRVTSVSSASSITPNVDTTDMFIVSELIEDLTINNPLGIPVQGQKLLIRITDDGTTRNLTFDTQYRINADTIGLPPTTNPNGFVPLYMYFVWNTENEQWDLLFMIGDTSLASGTFVDGSANTITVVNGLITTLS